MMGSKRNRKRAKVQSETLDPTNFPPPDIFRHIISQIEASQGLQSPSLKRLYSQLIYLSTFQQGCVVKEAAVNGFFMKIGNSEVWVAYREIDRLSDILFNEFHKRFEQLFFVRHDVSEIMALGQLESQQTDTWAATDELNLLSRCCMIVLNLPVSQENLMENGKALLMILRKLSLTELGGNDKDCSASSSEKNADSLTSIEPLNPRIPLLSAILEVFVDELLVHGQLRKKLLLLDSFSPTRERLFMHLSTHGDLGIVSELISAHFLLSAFDESAIKDFVSRLDWVQGKMYKSPELSLTTARALLLGPIMRFAPNLVQAYLISLVSDTICIGLGSESSKPEPKLVHCYLSTFESSVILYTQTISWLQTELHPIGSRACLLKSSRCGKTYQPSFETYLEESKKLKLDNLIAKVNDSWDSHLRSIFSKRKSDLVTLCTANIQDSQYMLDKSCKDEITSIIKCMVVKAAADVHDISVHPNENTSLEDICLLASLLKLMSSSLLQALWCLRGIDDPHCHRTLKDVSFVSIISSFEEFNIHLPIQTILYDIMERHPTKHVESKLMLLHFLGLLSLSFRTGLDFLVKSCILIIMAVLNLFVFEEGNLDALRSLTASVSESSLPVKPPVNYQEALVDQSFSEVAASELEKRRSLNLSTVSFASNFAELGGLNSQKPSSTLLPDSMKHAPVMEEEVCNGESFLRSMLGNSQELPDLDDLSDFIVCQKGKNYTKWLKNREHFRKMKFEREAKARWKKKQKVYRSVVGKNTRRPVMGKKP